MGIKYNNVYNTISFYYPFLCYPGPHEETIGRYCTPYVNLNVNSLEEAQQKCSDNSLCTMFFKDCDNNYHYCRLGATLQNLDCTTLFSKGKCSKFWKCSNIMLL